MVMINNRYDGKTNFTARLDLSNIKLNKRKWNSVAQMFEAKTQKDAYTFQISDNSKRIDIYALSDVNNDIEHSCLLSNDGTQKLMELPEEKITQKLIKLLNVFKHQDKTRADSVEFLEKFEKSDKYGTLNSPHYENGDSIYDRVFYPILDKMKADRASAMSKDSIFRDADFVD